MVARVFSVSRIKKLFETNEVQLQDVCQLLDISESSLSVPKEFLENSGIDEDEELSYDFSSPPNLTFDPMSYESLSKAASCSSLNHLSGKNRELVYERAQLQELLENPVNITALFEIISQADIDVDHRAYELIESSLGNPESAKDHNSEPKLIQDVSFSPLRGNDADDEEEELQYVPSSKTVEPVDTPSVSYTTAPSNETSDYYLGEEIQYDPSQFTDKSSDHRATGYEDEEPEYADDGELTFNATKRSKLLDNSRTLKNKEASENRSVKEWDEKDLIRRSKVALAVLLSKFDSSYGHSGQELLRLTVQNSILNNRNCFLSLFRLLDCHFRPPLRCFSLVVGKLIEDAPAKFEEAFTQCFMDENQTETSSSNIVDMFVARLGDDSVVSTLFAIFSIEQSLDGDAGVDIFRFFAEDNLMVEKLVHELTRTENSLVDALNIRDFIVNIMSIEDTDSRAIVLRHVFAKRTTEQLLLCFAMNQRASLCVLDVLLAGIEAVQKLNAMIDFTDILEKSAPIRDDVNVSSQLRQGKLPEGSFELQLPNDLAETHDIDALVADCFVYMGFFVDSFMSVVPLLVSFLDMDQRTYDQWKTFNKLNGPIHLSEGAHQSHSNSAKNGRSDIVYMKHQLLLLLNRVLSLSSVIYLNDILLDSIYHRLFTTHTDKPQISDSVLLSLQESTDSMVHTKKSMDLADEISSCVHREDFRIPSPKVRGDTLKYQLIKHNCVSVVLDLVERYPNVDLLHTGVLSFISEVLSTSLLDNIMALQQQQNQKDDDLGLNDRLADSRVPNSEDDITVISGFNNYVVYLQLDMFTKAHILSTILKLHRLNEDLKISSQGAHVYSYSGFLQVLAVQLRSYHSSVKEFLVADEAKRSLGLIGNSSHNNNLNMTAHENSDYTFETHGEFPPRNSGNLRDVDNPSVARQFVIVLNEIEIVFRESKEWSRFMSEVVEPTEKGWNKLLGQTSDGETTTDLSHNVYTAPSTIVLGYKGDGFYDDDDNDDGTGNHQLSHEDEAMGSPTSTEMAG